MTTLTETARTATTDAGIDNDPLWFKDAVIYQLHVKSFFDGNDDGVGDFRGLIGKLDYIVRLGANTIWLLPFYPSPRRDDGYDIAQYEGVHPDYGTLEDASAFIDAAHACGLRVITELVINHTSDQHPWFQRARSAPRGSPERDYYVWSDDDQAYAGTRIIFCDTEKSNWTFDPVAGQYFWHRFYSHQPDLNFDNPAVLDAVLKVMHFWLRLGVDGLRLDAVPYLIEREGTSNENLPETHAILKRIRAEIDAHFPGRMLLAEANMWPEDTQQYFGDVRDGVGDECHMAFHFPLMPRMYMAIAREDRFPITDIIRQTPDIPDNCQWAIFLRNHDELTLEMVTDSERDYLWQTYAEDRRARINLGIRRRLAPLLQHDRRRIELMTALLLTLPGTPVLYYGDEIGMGDNIHLGDRDGVRTPMQWSIDRNGGFSRSDPAALVLPPIMDALYGYAAVNVEAQERDSYSQLNWTRRVLAVRKSHRAFGRGTLELLYPGNRRIMAYVREFGDDTLLCVANLSRNLQAVELDIGRFEGRVPLDIIGGAAFPPVGKLPYLLTLPPYGFYVFQLASGARMPEWHVPPPEALPEYRTLVLRGVAGVPSVLAEHRAVLAGEILPTYLAKRRWFAEKDRRITRIDLVDVGSLPGIDDVAFIALDVGFDEGDSARYQLPLAIVWESAELAALPQQLALARVRQGRRVGYLTDAFSLESFARGIVRAIGSASDSATSVASLRATAGVPIDVADDAEVHWLVAEQSNSSLVVGDRVIVKLVRRMRDGIQPELEMARALRNNANVPALMGDVTLHGADGTRCTLVVVQQFIRNQGDGWRWCLDYQDRAIDEWRVAADEARREEILAGYAMRSARVGHRLAELHAQLALLDSDPAFTPSVVTEGRAAELGDRAAAEMVTTLASLRHGASATTIDSDWNDTELGLRLRQLAESTIGALETRIHGDFHLGQILINGEDIVIVDFEGEPALPLAERRAKASPLRDVAGYLRSLDYAEQSVRVGSGSTRVVDADGEECVRRLRESAQHAFLSAYRSGLEGATRPWIGNVAFDRVLAYYLIAKAAYEVRYELANRPAWLPIAVAGLRAQLGSAT